jgi:very-short-patch-repair endonuclease
LEDRSYDRQPTQRSRDLRTHATDAERKLWSILGNCRLAGVRFNRQVPIGPFICDFVARSRKLIVEADGGQHSEALDYDHRRTAFLTARGYHLIRFWNNDILENLEGVAQAINEALTLTPPAGAGGEEPRSGEGEGRSIGEAPALPRSAAPSRPLPLRREGRMGDQKT